MTKKEPELFISSRSIEKEAVDNLNAIFLELMEQGISDLHMIELEDYWQFKIRTPIGLSNFCQVAKQEGTLYSDKIKSRCNISISERIKPSDGRFRLRFFDESIQDLKGLDVRVNISFSVRGEYIVCRLLDQKNANISINALGLPEHYIDAIKQLNDAPQGLFVISGPTGSGKTTTLYAILNMLNDGTRNIITIEEPVEYMVDGIQQFNVDGLNLTFPIQLRAAMRQDPDVILVGEIRDEITADIAAKAAATGHLVLATVHANSALHTVERLHDLGLEPSRLALVLNGVVAQRLLPKIDISEGFPYFEEPNDIDRLWLDMNGITSQNIHIPNPNHPTKGKVPVMELFILSEKARLAIARGAFGELPNFAIQQPWYDTLAQSGARLVFDGLVHLSHLKRIVTSTGDEKKHKRILNKMVESGELTFEEAKIVIEEQTKLTLKGIHQPISEVINIVRKRMIAEHLGFSFPVKATERPIEEMF
jgi:general secretion pathway protein E